VQIVDYKTGKPKDAEKLDAEGKEQLLLYQLAMKQALNKKIDNLQFYYLDNNTEVNFLGTDKELKEMEEKTIERIQGIQEAAKSGHFPPKPSQLCGFCDFKEICEFRKV